jgi:hypothetical protein
MTPRRRVVGVDFSGARDAGRLIWIAEGRLVSGSVRVEACFSATDLPGGGTERDAAHAALVAYLALQSDALVGLDLPFSLPRALIPDRAWVDFVRAYPARFATSAEFRSAAVAAGNGRELKRRTDIETRVPFAPANMRMYRQVHYGIGAILSPLISADAARAIPMQAPAEGKPILAEICPASLLKSLDLYPSYKGTTSGHRDARRRILAGLVARRLVAGPSKSLEDKLIGDRGGDALDAVLAAIAAARTTRLDPRPRDDLEAVEGRVYC